MDSETIDYGAVLADLEAKRTSLDNAIAAVRQLLNLGAEQSAGSSGTDRKESPTRVQSDSFFGMSTPDAVRKYLGIAKRPQSLSEITKALQEGNLPTTSSNLLGIVGPTLSRMKAAGDVISVQGKWGLAEWYPAARRDRIEAVAKAKKGVRKRGRPKKTVETKTEQKTSSKPTAQQIEQMKTLYGAGKSIGEIAKEIGVHQFTVYRALNSKRTDPAAAQG